MPVFIAVRQECWGDRPQSGRVTMTRVIGLVMLRDRSGSAAPAAQYLAQLRFEHRSSFCLRSGGRNSRSIMTISRIRNNYCIPLMSRVIYPTFPRFFELFFSVHHASRSSQYRYLLSSALSSYFESSCSSVNFSSQIASRPFKARLRTIQYSRSFMLRESIELPRNKGKASYPI